MAILPPPLKKIFFVAFCLTVFSAAFAQMKFSPNPIAAEPAFAKGQKGPGADGRFTGLDTAFARVLAQWKAPGFAVAVVEGDKLVYAKGFGYKDWAAKKPVTPNTVFAIGSCT